MSNGNGSGSLPKGGFYNTYTSAENADWTLVAVKISEDHAACTRPPLPKFNVESETLTFTLATSMGAVPKLAVWRSNMEVEGAPIFEQEASIVVNTDRTYAVWLVQRHTLEYLVCFCRNLQPPDQCWRRGDSQHSSHSQQGRQTESPLSAGVSSTQNGQFQQVTNFFPSDTSDPFLFAQIFVVVMGFPYSYKLNQEAAGFADQIGVFEIHTDASNSSNQVRVASRVFLRFALSYPYLERLFSGDAPNGSAIAHRVV